MGLQDYNNNVPAQAPADKAGCLAEQVDASIHLYIHIYTKLYIHIHGYMWTYTCTCIRTDKAGCLAEQGRALAEVINITVHDEANFGCVHNASTSDSASIPVDVLSVDQAMVISTPE